MIATLERILADHSPQLRSRLVCWREKSAILRRFEPAGALALIAS